MQIISLISILTQIKTYIKTHFIKSTQYVLFRSHVILGARLGLGATRWGGVDDAHLVLLASANQNPPNAEAAFGGARQKIL